MLRNNRIQGFTLIEMVIVIAMVGILMAVAIPNFRGYSDTAKVAAMEHNTHMALRHIKNVVLMHNLKISQGESPASTPATMPEIIIHLNEGNNAPGGGDAFGATPDVTTGKIGLSTTSTATSTTKHPPNATFTVTPPATYGGKTHTPVTITPL